MSRFPRSFVTDDVGWPATSDDWLGRGRPEAMTRLGAIYGPFPDVAVQLTHDTVDETVLDDGASLLRQSAITVTTEHGSWKLCTAAWIPADTPVRGIVLGGNFQGNHATNPSPALRICDGSDPRLGRLYYENAEFRPPAERGSLSHRWPVQLINRRGYAVVTFSYLQCGPDSPNLFHLGAHPAVVGPGRQAYRWGAIGVWAWTLSRVLDLIEQGHLVGEPNAPVIGFGHSRMGKTALWAAAQDQRFAGVIANQSGAMGAALSRDVGETPAILAHVRPYWFTEEFSELALGTGLLPVNQDKLLACIAPRILIVGSAEGDFWADPAGEQLATHNARRVWALTGDENRVRYHLRPGIHEVYPEDWAVYLAHLDELVG